jgi:hypothetical protein
VFLAIVLIYVAIMARRLMRTERDLAELKHDLEESELSEERVREDAPARERDWGRDPEVVS